MRSVVTLNLFLKTYPKNKHNKSKSSHRKLKSSLKMRLLKNGQIISGQNRVREKGKSKTKKLKSEITMRSRKLKFLKKYRSLLTQYYY